MAERKHGAKAPETESTVTGADWCGDDISGQRHTRVLFVDLDMTEVENHGAVFEECTFRRARFNVSTHNGAAFVNCTFANCNFYDARFSDCKLVGSMFDRCTFDAMQVAGGNWSFVGLPGADLRTASFRGVQMREADLTGARCQGATLRDADLSGASLHAADLSRCDLRGSDLSALDPEHVELRGAIITIDQTIAIAEALGLDVRVE
ncbi:MAG TPA: pentapeptide repeat-containing protein [Longimicrobium sp.]|nr:pentapeptide repeat-containing protein [Longimicrobium sp.]